MSRAEVAKFPLDGPRYAMYLDSKHNVWDQKLDTFMNRGRFTKGRVGGHVVFHARLGTIKGERTSSAFDFRLLGQCTLTFATCLVKGRHELPDPGIGFPYHGILVPESVGFSTPAVKSERGSDVCHLTGTRQDTIGFSMVIQGDFLPGPDGTATHQNSRPIGLDHHQGIGPTRVIDETKRVKQCFFGFLFATHESIDVFQNTKPIVKILFGLDIRPQWFPWP